MLRVRWSPAVVLPEWAVEPDPRGTMVLLVLMENLLLMGAVRLRQSSMIPVCVLLPTESRVLLG